MTLSISDFCNQVTRGTVSALDQNPELNTEHLRIEVHPSGYLCIWFEGFVEKLSDHQQEMVSDGEMTHLSILLSFLRLFPAMKLISN